MLLWRGNIKKLLGQCLLVNSKLKFSGIRLRWAEVTFVKDKAEIVVLDTKSR